MDLDSLPCSFSALPRGACQACLCLLRPLNPGPLYLGRHPAHPALYSLPLYTAPPAALGLPRLDDKPSLPLSRAQMLLVQHEQAAKLWRRDSSFQCAAAVGGTLCSSAVPPEPLFWTRDSLKTSCFLPARCSHPPAPSAAPGTNSGKLALLPRLVPATDLHVPLLPLFVWHAWSA